MEITMITNNYLKIDSNQVININNKYLSDNLINTKYLNNNCSIVFF